MSLLDIFSRNLSDAVPEEDTGAPVKVLGTGCENCQNLRENARIALNEMNIDTRVDMITDFKKISSYGVMMIPTLVINGQVVSSGKKLKVKQLEKLFEKYPPKDLEEE